MVCFSSPQSGVVQQSGYHSSSGGECELITELEIKVQIRRVTSQLTYLIEAYCITGSRFECEGQEEQVSAALRLLERTNGDGAVSHQYGRPGEVWTALCENGPLDRPN